MKKVHPPRMGFATPAAARADHFSPACHVFVILLAQSLHHFVGGLASGERSPMAADDECLRYAHEYARLAGLTDYQHVRDQLLDLARGWTAIAQHERRFTPASTSRGPQRPSVLHLLLNEIAQHECRSDARVLRFRQPPLTDRNDQDDIDI
jgi:hypothetical protein